MNDKLIQPIGYTEMYEWSKIPEQNRFGLFVQFNKHYPDLIEPYHSEDGVLAGVSSICSVVESDNPEQWKYAYMCNAVGDVFVKEETIAVGIKCYDQHNEMSYMSTRPYKHYVKVPNKYLDSSRQYVPRTDRKEWVRVTLLGKALVRDDGTLRAGQFCMPYTGDDMQKAGTAVAWDGKSKNKFYVLERMTDSTVQMVINSFV